MEKITRIVLWAAVIAFVAITYYLLKPASIDKVIDNSAIFREQYGACPFPGKKIDLTPAEWKKRLTPEQYLVLRQGETEKGYTGELTDHKGEGTYLCAACRLPVFRSQDKYDAQTGWPSFRAPINPCYVGYKVDTSLSVASIEVLCNQCNSHLGHVFDDGPPPTFHRYSINSIALEFVNVNLSPVEIPEFDDSED